MSNDKVQLGVEVSGELKNLVDADARTNRDVVEAALWREFGGVGKSGIQQRIEEVENRISLYESEIADRKQEIDTERQRLQSYREELHERQTTLERVLDEASNALTPEAMTDVNPAIENWAAKTDLSPEEFLKELKERME